MSSKTQTSKEYNTRSHTCPTQPLVWTQGSNRANYWSRWALIRLLPAGWQRQQAQKKIAGCLEGGTMAGRGAGALQLNIRSGDDPPPGCRELEAEVEWWCVIGEHIAFWLQPSSVLNTVQYLIVYAQTEPGILATFLPIKPFLTHKSLLVVCVCAFLCWTCVSRQRKTKTVYSNIHSKYAVSFFKQSQWLIVCVVCDWFSFRLA